MQFRVSGPETIAVQCCSGVTKVLPFFGALEIVLPQLLGAFSNPARVLAIEFGLLTTEGIACRQAAGSRFDTADAAPTITQLGWKKTHLVFGVVYTAAVAVHRFRHRNLGWLVCLDHHS